MGIEAASAGLLNGCKVVAKSLVWISACLLAVGLAASQLLLGGWWYPALASPGYLLVGAAAVVAGVAFWRTEDAPGAFCTGITVLFAGYLFWRQWDSSDSYAAREDSWLLLGALAVYFTAAWQLRDDKPRWLVLGVLFALSSVQVVIAVAQFAADKPFHPLAELAMQMRLPDGKEAGANLGLITGTLHARTALSGVLEVTTFLALGMLVWGRGAVWAKLLLLWVCMVGFVGMIICLSRSAYLALPSGAAVFALASFFVVQRGVVANRFWLGVGALLLIVLSLGLGVATGWESIAVWLRLSEMTVDQYRESLWAITVPPMLQLDPVFGAGANNFEDLARRYRGEGFTADPIHAHSDWLQLLIEYGWVGFLLGASLFWIHFAAGWRNILRLAAHAPVVGLLPQSMNLGLATGALAAFAAIGSHVAFDYSLHVPAVALLTALCAGWLAATRSADPSLSRYSPAWLRPLFCLPALPGLALVVLMWRVAPVERLVLRSENALVSSDPSEVALLCRDGLALDPDHPRLLWLAGFAARQQAVSTAREYLSGALLTIGEATSYFRRAAEVRPNDVFVHYEYGRALDISALMKMEMARSLRNPFRAGALRLDAENDFDAALKAHLRAIGRDPDHARGYESLARHYLAEHRYDDARSLAYLAMHLTGASEAKSLYDTAEKAAKSQTAPR